MRTKVLVKHKLDVRWEDPEVGAYPDESKLKMILRDDPALLPFDELRRPVVMVDEFPVSIGESFGFIDLVGVSRTGAITVVECKLEKNPDIKRRLVGQLIEYAAALWGMTYEAFDALWQALDRPPMTSDEEWDRQKRPPLDEEVAKALADDPSFDRGTFRAAVEENLRAGRFTLVVAVDSITTALEQSILYLSEHSGTDTRFVALELGYVAHGDIEVLVPRAFGLETAERRATVTASRSRNWDTASFDAALLDMKGEAALELATSLRVWATGPEIGLQVTYGRGAIYGTEGFALTDPAGTKRSVFSLSTSGGVTVHLGDLKNFPAYTDEAARLEILHALAPIEGRSRKDEQAGGWPGFSTDVLRDTTRMGAFKVLIADVVTRISPE